MSRLLFRPARRRMATAQDGAAAAEFALVFPVFFVLLFGAFEFARACFAWNTLQYVVSQGARYVMTSPAGKPNAGNCATSLTTYQTSVKTYVTTLLATYLPSAPAPTVTASNCTASPSTVTVTVNATYTFNFILSGLMPWGPITIHQKAIVTTPLT